MLLCIGAMEGHASPFSEKEILEQISEGSEGVSHTERFISRKKIKCKGPEVEASLPRME